MYSYDLDQDNISQESKCKIVEIFYDLEEDGILKFDDLKQRRSASLENYLDLIIKTRNERLYQLREFLKIQNQ
ncbi:unnamed protein product [Paramecium sonneborni]|uniref:Uncharacterized protein n=1 Tax=Paramecium sonneborni TaxID=65129 RepID=A0A8S1P1Y3_9CILI|nr:unnamed protein product [Paramecium sonneborni]